MIVNRFAEVMVKKGLDCRDVVKMTGLDNHIVRKLYKGQITRIDFKTLNKICYALECNTSDIFRYIPD